MGSAFIHFLRCLGVLSVSLVVFAVFASPAFGSEYSPKPVVVWGVPIDFVLFALTLLGVAMFHHHTLRVAVCGLLVITTYKLVTGFAEGPGFVGLLRHVEHEWVVLSNLLGLLLGFGLLANHFEHSRMPDVLPRFLPRGWVGGLALLALVFVLSTFLDNIAAAMIGGTVAMTVFDRRVHIGYLAAIVAASNAGGAGSVVGDTTTTMMWIDGVSPLQVLPAFLAAFVALIVFSIPAAILQHKHSPLSAEIKTAVSVDWARMAIVGLVLAAAVATNVIVNTKFSRHADAFPFIGVAVVLTLVATSAWRRPEWRLLPESLKGSVFLLCLVFCASMMPVDRLPDASWQTTLGLGMVSAIFDNIPLTKLALEQGGYDWGYLAFAVGFGGSMMWFGSSAGVALCTIFPEAKSGVRWLRHGWPIVVAYLVGFMAMYVVLGWHPGAH